MNYDTNRSLVLITSGGTNRAKRPASAPVIAGAMLAIIAVVSAGCGFQGKREPPTPVAHPVSAVQCGFDRPARTFVDAEAGVSVTYPVGWEPKATDAFVLMLLPAKTPSRSTASASTLLWGEHFISLDVPELPAFRIPGFLPMGRIRSGYVDDLLRQAPHATTIVLEPPAIPDAKASLVRTTWPGDQPTHVETALILTHSDRVYIIRARSPVEDAVSTNAAFDQMVGSLHWSGDGNNGGASAFAAAGQANH